jgi:hypothetical protein
MGQGNAEKREQTSKGGVVFNDGINGVPDGGELAAAMMGASRIELTYEPGLLGSLRRVKG